MSSKGFQEVYYIIYFVLCKPHCVIPTCISSRVLQQRPTSLFNDFLELELCLFPFVLSFSSSLSSSSSFFMSYQTWDWSSSGLILFKSKLFSLRFTEECTRVRIPGCKLLVTNQRDLELQISKYDPPTKSPGSANILPNRSHSQD